LSSVKTSRAKARIRAWLKYIERSRSLTVGREILDRDLRRHRLDLKRIEKVGQLRSVAESFGLKDAEALIASIGYGKITSRQVLSRLLPDKQIDAAVARRESTLRKLFRRMAGQSAGVQVSGVDDVMVHFGKCCNPLPGESILGFITRGRGVTVHATDCPRVLESDPQRQVDVVWESGSAGIRPVILEVKCVDKPGMLAAMTKAIGNAGVNISSAQVQSTPDKQALNRFEVMVETAAQLNGVMKAIGKVRGVSSVRRPPG
jgi:GTP pyrophosphokinase